MSFITLISDWKQDSLYSSVVKGKLISISENFKIIDLISNINNFDILEAAFILKNSYKNFPDGTIHLNFVSNLSYLDAEFLIVEYQNQYFISADNGFLSIVFENHPKKIRRVPRTETSFDEIEFFPLLVKLIITDKLHKLELIDNNYLKTPLPQPAILTNRLVGHILFIDVYGNVISNFTKEFIDNNSKGRKFYIVIQSERYKITTISKSYFGIKSGELLCLYNSFGHLEIAIKDGNMAELISITKKDQISIIFEEEKKIKKIVEKKVVKNKSTNEIQGTLF